MRRLPLAFLVLTSSVNWSVSAQTSNVITDPEVYAVYASTPLSWLASRDNVSQLLIAEETRDSGGSTCLKRLPADWADVADDYQRQNRAPHTLRQGFDLGAPYELLQRPYAQVPRGMFLYLSAVGFNADRTRALVSLTYTCAGVDCAQGWQLRRIKENGVWRSLSVQAEGECIWIE